MAANHADARLTPSFAAYLPDLRWIDRDCGGLFTVIGRIRGPFSAVSQWQWLDQLLSSASATVLKGHGEQRWHDLGGQYDADGKPTCEPSSGIAKLLIRHVAARNSGLLWQDEQGNAWAVRLVPLSQQDSVLALAIQAPEAAICRPGREIASGVTGSREQLRQALVSEGREMRLYHRAEQLLWLFHTLVLEQRRSEIVIPDVLLGQITWGGDRTQWPQDWRQDMLQVLNSLASLHSGALDVRRDGWRPVLRPESRLILAVEDISRNQSRSAGCPAICPMHTAVARHGHFRVQIGPGFLGVLGYHRMRRDANGCEYDFHSMPQGNAGQRLEQARNSGRVGTYSVLSRVLGKAGHGILNARQQAIVDALIGEVSRSRRSDREDKADIVTGNRVQAPSGRGTLGCLLLQSRRRYVSFNGNGVRKHRGYRVIGDQGRGWLYKCGFGVSAAAVLSFLSALDGLSEALGLVVAAVDPRAGTWVDLPSLLTMARSRSSWRDIDRLHLRVYGPEDYLQRLRTYMADAAGFNGIPAPAAVPAADSVELDLKARMTRLGITQAELAEHLGKKRPYIAAVLNGRRPWPRGDLRQRCEAFVATREREAEGN